MTSRLRTTVHAKIPTLPPPQVKWPFKHNPSQLICRISPKLGHYDLIVNATCFTRLFFQEESFLLLSRLFNLLASFYQKFVTQVILFLLHYFHRTVTDSFLFRLALLFTSRKLGRN
jgi:hypothetical protein